jgi:hypothetical protein
MRGAGNHFCERNGDDTVPPVDSKESVSAVSCGVRPRTTWLEKA